jgi:hypothetical protein
MPYLKEKHGAGSTGKRVLTATARIPESVGYRAAALAPVGRYRWNTLREGLQCAPREFDYDCCASSVPQARLSRP